MVGKRNCAVVGCTDETSSRHRFPEPNRDKERYVKWIKASGNTKLQNLDPDLVYRSHRICHKHFPREAVASNMYLQKNAVPLLYLPPPTELSESSQLPDQGSTTESSPSVSTTHKITDENIELSEGLPADLESSDSPVSSVRPVLLATTTEKEESCHLLAEVNVSRSQKLSPKARHLYHRAKGFQRQARMFKQRNLTLKKKLKMAKQTMENGSFWKRVTPSNATVAQFCMSQYHLSSKAPKGRRYSLEDKLMSLAIYKHSGRGYRFLSKMFALPSSRTLRRILTNIPIRTGINDVIFAEIKSTISDMKPMDKLCIVMFDEMVLTPSLTYDASSDTILGFEDLGDVQTLEIAQYVQVFMIRGVFKKWKQPLAYFFTKSGMKTADLKRILKNIIYKLTEAGLTIIATVCDQGSTNQACINSLLEDTKRELLQSGSEMRDNCFIVANQSITALYDPPHLLKGVRNNMLSKNLIWQQDDKVITGKWSDVVKAYHIDAASGDIRALPKITEQHVNMSKLKKMKVSCCSQVFSHTMAATISIMARNNEKSLDGTFEMEGRGKETALIIHFLDQLFDSVNGGTLYSRTGKKLRCGVSNSSDHMTFWSYAVKALKNMYFQPENTNKKVIPPSLRNFINTLNGFQSIWKTLQSRNVKYFLPRRFTQDALENFFCQIRQQGARNVSPNTATFTSHFKTLLIQNIVSCHSLAANCEASHTVGNPLLDLQHFISDVTRKDTPPCPQIPTVHIPDNILTRQIDLGSIGYVSGFITKKVLRKFHCKYCKIHIVIDRNSVNPTDPYYEYTVEKEFVNSIPKKLSYCRPTFLMSLTKCYNITKYFLDNLNSFKNCKKQIVEYVKKHVQFTFICEHKTEIITYIIETFVCFLIYVWCKGINRILSGKDCRNMLYLSPMYQKARYICIKNRK